MEEVRFRGKKVLSNFCDLTPSLYCVLIFILFDGFVLSRYSTDIFAPSKIVQSVIEVDASLLEMSTEDCKSLQNLYKTSS